LSPKQTYVCPLESTLCDDNTPCINTWAVLLHKHVSYMLERDQDMHVMM
jgi:hypothetical protein